MTLGRKPGMGMQLASPCPVIAADQRESSMPDKPFYVPRMETHLIDSKYVDQQFEIRVFQPLMRRESGERFPVLYFTDGNAGMDFAKGVAHVLQTSGQVRRFILVGICYPGDNPCAGNILRMRDYTPDYRPEAGYPKRSPIEGVVGFAEGQRHWHGAADFLAFIRNELIPLIDERYPTVIADRCYFGHSMAGGLGVYALAAHSDLFSRYVISSPAVSWDGDEHGIKPVRDFIATRKSLQARLHMSVGSEEEFEPLVARMQFVSSFYRLAALLRAAGIPGLEFTHEVLANETHASVWPAAFSRGVQAIYGRPERPPIAIEDLLGASASRGPAA